MRSKLAGWIIVGSSLWMAQVGAQPTMPFLDWLAHEPLSLTASQENVLSQKANEIFGGSCQSSQIIALKEAIPSSTSDTYGHAINSIVISLSDLGYVGPARLGMRDKLEVFSFSFAKKGESAVVGELVLGQKPLLSWCWIVGSQAQR